VKIERGEFVLKVDRSTGVVKIWFGDPDTLGSESEWVGELSITLVPDLISGLRAVQEQTKQ
jgi:hypothetical protein